MGHVILGTKEPRIIVQGRFVLGRLITPSIFHGTVRLLNGGVTRCPEMMCPRRNVLGPLVPNSIVPGDTMSLD